MLKFLQFSTLISHTAVAWATATAVCDISKRTAWFSSTLTEGFNSGMRLYADG